METPVCENTPEVMVDLEQHRQHSRGLNDLEWERRVKSAGRPGWLAKSVRIVPAKVILEHLRSVRRKRDGRLESPCEIRSIRHHPNSIQVRDAFTWGRRVRRKRQSCIFSRLAECRQGRTAEGECCHNL